MKIKIGDKIYDSENEPIMVILSEQDKKNIKNMLPEATKYCSYPEGMEIKVIKDFMKLN
jgi:hypothetical protein